MEIKLSIPYTCTKKGLKEKLENELDKIKDIYGLTISNSSDSIKALTPGENPTKGIFEIQESTLEVYLNLPNVPEGTEVKIIEERLKKLVQ